jgi:hypothetical protein
MGGSWLCRLIFDMSCTDCQKVKVELRLMYAKKT